MISFCYESDCFRESFLYSLEKFLSYEDTSCGIHLGFPYDEFRIFLSIESLWYEKEIIPCIDDDDSGSGRQ